MSINIDLSQITPSGDGKYYEAFPDGDAQVSFGNAALGGTYTNDTLTITTDGTNPFGTKTLAAPVLWDFGTDVYENGVANTHRSGVADGYVVEDSSVNSSEVYGNASDVKIVTTSRTLRHGNSTGHYMPVSASNNPFVDSPDAEGVTVAEHDYHYLAFRIKYKYHFKKIHVIDYTGKVGTFNTPDLVNSPDSLGEQLTLNNGEEAYILQDTGSRLCFYTPNTTSRLNDLANTTITGQASGATCTVTDNGTSTDDHSGPEKIVRVWSEDDGSSGMRYTLNRTSSAFTGGTTVQEVYGDINNTITEDEWGLIELFIDLANNRGLVAVDGAIISDLDITAYDGYSGTWDTTKGMRQRAIGWQYVRTLYNVVEFGEIYLDHAQQRCFIGDAATWGACTAYELQRPTAHSNLSATYAINLGAFASLSGKYLYVINSGYPASSDAGVLL